MEERYVEIKGNIVAALRNVFDPEMPSVSVLDLGLIYELHVTNEGQVECKHTLTSMMCPFADQICQDIEDAIKDAQKQHLKEFNQL